MHVNVSRSAAEKINDKTSDAILKANGQYVTSIGDEGELAAGDRVSDDAIRSLAIPHKVLGTNEWFVVHHTDCGMLTFIEIMSELLDDNLETAAFDGRKSSNRARRRLGPRPFH